MELSTDGSLHVDCTGKLRTSRQSALHAIQGMNNGLYNELVYILAGKWPLQLDIAKLVYRFVESMKDNPNLVSELLAWLQ